MKRIKISENFYLDEFVPPTIYKKYGRKSTWFINPILAKAVQIIRTHFGKSVTINNWWGGGHYKNRGFRSPYTKVGVSLSQHRFCNALDFTVSGISSNKVRTFIRKNYKELGLTAIEDGITWVHIDCRWTNSKKLMVFYPKGK